MLSRRLQDFKNFSFYDFVFTKNLSLLEIDLLDMYFSINSDFRDKTLKFFIKNYHYFSFLFFENEKAIENKKPFSEIALKRLYEKELQYAINYKMFSPAYHFGKLERYL